LRKLAPSFVVESRSRFNERHLPLDLLQFLLRFFSGCHFL
jgi:hypothetical protein